MSWRTTLRRAGALDPEEFLRVHRSYIVNTEGIPNRENRPSAATHHLCSLQVAG
ncbi:MAG: hypothetical protein GEU90_12925 [Gemmatimonas sp.]|nr:hypothetical protein [Gemmatimonas sp.]